MPVCRSDGNSSSHTKGIGLPLDEAIVFWRKMYGPTMSDDKFNKEYKYNIRHSYGQEGKRANYPPKSWVFTSCSFLLFLSHFFLLLPNSSLLYLRAHYPQMSANPHHKPTRHSRLPRLSLPTLFPRKPRISPYIFLPPTRSIITRNEGHPR